MSVLSRSFLHKLFITVLLLLAVFRSTGMAEPAPIAEVVLLEEVAEPALDKHYLRTAIQEAMALAGGTAWYWIDRERQVADWDFPSLAERLTLDVMRYDNNPFHVNFAWHAGNGTAFHLWARVNGLSFLESVGAGFLTSLTWEYALEYREKVSINDLIFTTGAGIPMGEFMHVLGRYLSEDPAAARVSLARWTAGFPTALTRVLDGREEASLSTRPDFWHEMHLAYEISAGRVSPGAERGEHSLHTFHFDGRFVRIPRYLKTGVWSGYFRSAEFTEASMDMGGSAQGSSTRFFADTTLLGWYGQQIHQGHEYLSNATMVGIAMAYRYRREVLGDWDDKVGVLHFPGLAANLHLQWRDIEFEGGARMHLDFAGINALSNDDWNRAHPNEQGKAILRKQGYSYGYGASLGLSAQLRYGGLSGGARLWLGQYQSDEGLDRIQESVTLDQQSSDEILESELWLRLEGLPYRSYLALFWGKRERSATLEEFSASASLSRLSLQLGLAL